MAQSLLDIKFLANQGTIKTLGDFAGKKFRITAGKAAQL